MTPEKKKRVEKTKKKGLYYGRQERRKSSLEKKNKDKSTVGTPKRANLLINGGVTLSELQRKGKIYW